MSNGIIFTGDKLVFELTRLTLNVMKLNIAVEIRLFIDRLLL